MEGRPASISSAPSAGSTVHQTITLQNGIPIEKAREIVKKIKDSKLKVQGSIQGDAIRVSGAKKDDLQDAIAVLPSSKSYTGPDAGQTVFHAHVQVLGGKAMTSPMA